MVLVRRLLFLVGYFLFFGPPRALDLQRSENAKGGELSGLPTWAVLGIEAMVRGGSLLVFAVSIEALLGSYWYSHFMLDLVMGVVILVGLGHMLAYYLIFSVFEKRLGRLTGRVYRFARNICYAFLPGLAVIDAMLLWQALRPLELIPVNSLGVGYWISTAVLLAIGLLEAAIVKRQPLGLDKTLSGSNAAS